jgi:hypothetical protein
VGEALWSFADLPDAADAAVPGGRRPQELEHWLGAPRYMQRYF